LASAADTVRVILVDLTGSTGLRNREGATAAATGLAPSACCEGSPTRGGGSAVPHTLNGCGAN